MALYDLGKETGLTIDIGDEFTTITPIHDGYLLHRQIMKIDCGGNDIIDYFLRILQMKGYFLHPKSDFLIGRELKNKYCFDYNIPIIRIPYWHLDNICLNDLLLETTTFKI